MRPDADALNTAPGSSLIETNALDLSWLRSSSQSDLPEIWEDFDTRVLVFENRAFRLEVDESCSRIVLVVPDVPVVPLLLQTRFIDWSIAESHLVLRRMSHTIPLRYLCYRNRSTEVPQRRISQVFINIMHNISHNGDLHWEQRWQYNCSPTINAKRNKLDRSFSFHVSNWSDRAKSTWRSTRRLRLHNVQGNDILMRRQKFLCHCRQNKRGCGQISRPWNRFWSRKCARKSSLY